MRDLYAIFKDLEENNGGYRYPDSEDPGIPFDKVLEIVDQDELAGSYDEDE